MNAVCFHLPRTVNDVINEVRFIPNLPRCEVFRLKLTRCRGLFFTIIRETYCLPVRVVPQYLHKPSMYCRYSSMNSLGLLFIPFLWDTRKNVALLQLWKVYGF